MTDVQKKGIFRDPWRTAVPAPKPTAPIPPPPSDVDPDDTDVTAGRQCVSISLPNYGGITAHGTDNPQELGRRLLEFCVANQKIVEPYLLQYGIIIVKLVAHTKLNTVFYIQRSDGWTLAVPQANNREQGLLQLIQAFLTLSNNPSTHTLLEQAALRAYKQ
jgi:hypothetical protein